MEVEVVAFDVDGTLTVRDCVFPFLLKAGGAGRMARAVLGHPVRLASLVLRRDRDGLKAHFVRTCLGGLDANHVAAEGAEFASVVASGWMRADTAAALRRHQDEGRVVVLVSASLSPYLEPLGEILEVDAVLCTSLEERDGVLTGELAGSNCRGDAKVEALRRWAGEAGISHDGWLVAAYGDSSGDTEMLALARRGVEVSRTDVVPA
jgi:phosphatidylglycerophosphatase C